MSGTESQQLVWVRTTGGNGGTKGIYHTDRDCPRLQRANNAIQKALDVLHDDARECQFCSGEAPVNRPVDGYSIYNSAKEWGEQNGQ